MDSSGPVASPARQPAPLRVLLAVPDQVTGGSLAQLLATRLPRIEVVAQAGTESLALQLFFSLEPDVTVLDWRIADREPARLVGLIKRVAPGACVIALVPSPDSAPARAARALGADVVTAAAGLVAHLEAIERARVPVKSKP